MMENDEWYDDKDFLISYEALPQFILDGLLMLDSQAFGLVAAFPYAFICGTIASSLIILIIIQLTLKTIIVATGSFLAANITAYLFGSRLGWRLEQWHLYLLLEHGKLRNDICEHQSLPSKDIEKDSLTNHQNNLCENDFSESNNQTKIRPILRQRQRNWYFKMTFVVIIIIANILGMLIGGLCAANLPSRLRNNTEPWQDDYYK